MNSNYASDAKANQADALQVAPEVQEEHKFKNPFDDSKKKDQTNQHAELEETDELDQ